jgi:hypothetical protein
VYNISQAYFIKLQATSYHHVSLQATRICVHEPTSQHTLLLKVMVLVNVEYTRVVVLGYTMYPEFKKK